MRPTTQNAATGVPWSVRAAYSAPALALAAVGIPVYVYLPKFYSDVIGVSVGTIGALILAARLFDAVTDPAVGWLSDRAHTRAGRRRPFIGAAALPLAAAFALLFTPPASFGIDGSVVWLAIWLFATFAFWTLVTVPYEALGPELTSDYDERTSVLALRDGMLLAGTLAASAAPVLVGTALGLTDSGSDERTRFATLGLLYAPVLLGACWWCVAAVRERTPQPQPQPPAAAAGAMLRNRPFAVLLASYVVSAFGSNLPAALLLYYVEYVLQAGSAELFLVAYLLTGIVALPLWVWLSARIGKKNSWILAMCVNTGAFAGVWFLGPGDAVAYAGLVFVSGIGLGATLALPSSLQADVIDYDELLTGQRREGRYIGIWAVSRKAAAALGVGVALPILGAAGYQPNVAQTPAVVDTLRLLYAAVPCLCNIVAIALATAYPIDKQRQRDVLDAIARRRAGHDVTDPLHPDTLLPGFR